MVGDEDRIWQAVWDCPFTGTMWMTVNDVCLRRLLHPDRCAPAPIGEHYGGWYSIRNASLQLQQMSDGLFLFLTR